jgi:hypothetical protein
MLNGHHILRRMQQQGARRLQTYLRLKLHRRQAASRRE